MNWKIYEWSGEEGSQRQEFDPSMEEEEEAIDEEQIDMEWPGNENQG